MLAASALAGASVLILYALSRLLGDLLMVDRGLDRTDESLYLLTLSSPQPTSWNTPSEWNLRTLYALAGGRLVRMRTLGALLLVVAGGVLGALTSTLGARIGAEGSMRQRWLPWAAGAFGAATGSVAALSFYAAGLRLPGYNWLNLFGSIVACVGIVLAVGACATDRTRPERVGVLRPGVVLAAGWFLALPAKPTTAMFIAAAAAIAVSVAHGRRVAFRLVAVGGVCTSVLIASAVILGIWPRDPLEGIIRMLTLPPLAHEQEIGEAFAALGRVPGDIRAVVEEEALAVVALASCLVAVSFRARRHPAAPGVGFMAFACTAVAAVALADLPLPFVGVGPPASRIFHGPTAVGAVLIVLGAATFMVCWVESLRACVTLGTLAGSMTLVALVHGFGSTNGPIPQAAAATVLMLTAALGMLAGPLGRSRRSVAVAGFAMVVTLAISIGIVSATLADARLRPYRQAPFEEATAELDLGDRGGTVMVDPVTADLVAHWRSDAASQGWQAGMPLVTVTWRWSSFVPLILSARPPESAMITLFGWPNWLDLADRNIDDLDPAFARDAWLVTNDLAALGPVERHDVRAVLDRLASASGRVFPDDYVPVATVGAEQLWRPRS